MTDEPRSKSSRFAKLRRRRTPEPEPTPAVEEPQVGRRIARWADESDIEARRVEPEPAPTPDPEPTDEELVEMFADLIDESTGEPDPEPAKPMRILGTLRFKVTPKRPTPTPEPVDTTAEQTGPTFLLPPYHYGQRRTANMWTAFAYELPDVTATGKTIDAARENVKAVLTDLLAARAAAGEPIPVPFVPSVDPQFGQSLFERAAPVVEQKPTLGERAQRTWKNLTRPNRPDIQWNAKKGVTKAEARKQTTRSAATATGWLVTAAVAWGVLYGQTAVNLDRVDSDLYGAMIAPSDLIVYSDPVKVTSLDRGDMVRVTRTDSLVEFGYFESVTADGAVVLNIPTLDEKSTVLVDEVATVDQTLDGLAPVASVVQSPALAVAPLVLYGAVTLWLTRRRRSTST
ncbi:hypothetical protein [Aeromicrobium sp. 179-A 4D2 NHS]|uniref:hypothetical protein n=1 Tax=Aeromicrobium sp. 179-A 4D2 NHS TaxID=3142375 RepID=UPI0039A207B7